MGKDINVDQLIRQMAEKLQDIIVKRGLKDPVIVGIHSGGVWIAQRLQGLLGLTNQPGKLDISFYRDDFTRIGMNPQVRPSDLPFNVDDRHIILVDDVLHTGRTIRAALNEIFDYGRPASITLVALIERSVRELPIQADVVGLHMDLRPEQNVKLKGPEVLTLHVS